MLLATQFPTTHLTILQVVQDQYINHAYISNPNMFYKLHYTVSDLYTSVSNVTYIEYMYVY